MRYVQPRIEEPRAKRGGGDVHTRTAVTAVPAYEATHQARLTSKPLEGAEGRGRGGDGLLEHAPATFGNVCCPMI